MNNAVVLVLALAAAPCAMGQSLFVREQPAAVAAPEGAPPPPVTLHQASQIAIEPPEPRKIQVHELVTIIIEETSRQEAEQTLETDKQYDFKAALASFPDLQQLLKGQLREGIGGEIPSVGVNHDQKFKGDGSYERRDRFTARITAEVIDVKPNGVLVLEARKFIEKDKERQTLVIAGSCRTEDITSSNTILSSQMADLTLSVKNEGDVRRAGKKGVIPRALEALFAF